MTFLVVFTDVTSVMSCTWLYTQWKDIRVTRILSDTELLSDYALDVDGSGSSSSNYRILKCAAG